MSTYDFNPEVCLQVLHGIAEEIPSGVSHADIHRDLEGFVRNTITSRTKQLIDWLWKNYQIPQKLKHLEDLEKKAGKSVAWRPTTGKVDLNPTIATHWLNRKMELQKQIEIVKKESAMIIPYLEKTSEQSRQQLEEINSLKKRILQTHENMIHAENLVVEIN